MESNNLLYKLSEYETNVILKVIDRLSLEDIYNLATLSKYSHISDDIWYEIIKKRCGYKNKLYKIYYDITEFNRYNNTNYTSWRDAYIDAYRLSAVSMIRLGMIDLMWLKFNVDKLDNDMLIYLAKYPKYTFDRLEDILISNNLGSILTKQYNYDRAFEYYFNRDGKVDYNIEYDILLTAEHINELNMSRYKADYIHDLYEEHRGNIDYIGKIANGWFNMIDEDEVEELDVDMVVSGIIKSVVREDKLEYIHKFLDRYMDNEVFDGEQLYKILKYIDNTSLLSHILEYGYIDIYVIKWCMYNMKLLKKISSIVDMYVEDIADNELIDVVRLVNAGFKRRSDKVIVRGYLLYPPRKYTKSDFKKEEDYDMYMLHRDREYVMNMDIDKIVEYMYYIVRLYRFDIEVIHKLIRRLYDSGDRINSYKLMNKTNFRSELNDIRIDEYHINILEDIVKKINIKYIKNIRIIHNKQDNIPLIIETLINCELSSIYKPMILLKALIRNKYILSNSKSLNSYIKSFICNKEFKRAYPLQYIGDIFNINFAKTD